MKKILLFIAATIAAVAMVSCKKDNGGNKTADPAGGVTVAKDNLVLYMPFDDEKVSVGDVTFEKKVGKADFVAGRRGKAYANTAYAVDKEAYMSYKIGKNPFESCQSFTISAWVKAPLNVGKTAMMFSVNGGDPGMGSLCLFLEGWGDKDSLAVKGYLYNTTTEWKGQDIAFKNRGFLVDKWFLVSYSYDAATSKEALWANGQFVGDSQRWAGPEVDGKQDKLGALTLASDATRIYIGAWSALVENLASDAWRGYFNGTLDELRVYNKALTEAEQAELYRQEVSVLE